MAACSPITGNVPVDRQGRVASECIVDVVRFEKPAGADSRVGLWLQTSRGSTWPSRWTSLTTQQDIVDLGREVKKGSHESSVLVHVIVSSNKV